ncbi:alpha/beta hydrolase [Lactiplantibacillus garii]|uniref:alpha/beta hydrolase n=1 Tax=Lactiplantibacillus garii TaxID=2306423 RepID=UPI0015D02E46|nr:alpha/beta hydrolase [Lactiplantibacillus garii]
MKATTKQVLVGTAWLITLLAVIGGTMLWQHQVRKPRRNSTSVMVTSTERIPSVLLLDSSLDTEQQRQLIATMQRNNGSQSVINVQIFKSGKLKLSGKLRESDNRPYLKLQLPKNVGATKQSQLIEATLTTIKTKFQFKQYNLVSYGTGGLIATHYLENAPRRLSPAHFITIATAFNGTSTQKNSQRITPVATSHRTAQLTQFVNKRGVIDPSIKVLVVAGNAKGKRNGDGVVPLQSALAAQSVFRPIVKTYQQTVIRGWFAGHTSILESWKLSNVIQNFIN